MIPSVFSDVDTLAPAVILIALTGAFLLSLFTAFVYTRTHRGLSYSQSFVFSLVLLGTIGAVVMIIASGSILRAIGILGAFSIIRFRTAVKDPKDMAFLMLVLGVGMAMGAQMYFLALAATLGLCFIVWLLTAINFGSTRKHDALLRIMAGAQSPQAAFETILQRHTQSFNLLSASSHGDGVEFTYGIRPKKDTPPSELLQLLRKEKGVAAVDIFDAKHEVEF